MRYLSVCSGIEAASCAWHWLGWQPVGFAEIEDFPSAVLAHRYPGVKNYGDFTSIARSPELIAEIGPVDVLVGGTPCQSFSVAGLRGGLSDERGNLALEFFRLAEAVKPRWILWENVPGVLSSGDGRDFGAILGAMAYLGYGYAWRVLDAQYFGVPQRRRRVFLVGHSGGACESPATVLFEPEGVRRDPPQKRKARKGAAAPASAGPGERGEGFQGGDIARERWPADKTCTLNTLYGTKMGLEDQHVFAGASMFVPGQSPAVTSKWSKGSGGPAGDECQNLVAQPQPIPFDTTQLTHPANRSSPQPGDPRHPLAAGAHPPAVALGFNWQNGGGYGTAHDGLGITEDGIPPLSRSQVPAVTALGRVTHALTANGHDASEDGTGRGTPTVVAPCLDADMAKKWGNGQWVNQWQNVLAEQARMAVGVRRLTPRECERLQGFPDDWTLIETKPGKWAADGPRYKALGNSMAVPVMFWLGRRIAQVDAQGPYQQKVENTSCDAASGDAT
jgi:DNA (cytosine-5)-methyltransferase 1